MCATAVDPFPATNGGFISGLKERLWTSLEQPDGYIRALGRFGPILSKSWLWNDPRLLHRLGTIERIGFWKGDEWRTNKEVELARKEFLSSFRRLAGPRLQKITGWDDRRRLNKVLARSEARLGVVDPYCRPYRARLELTDACNLRCQMCPQSMWDWERNYAEEWVLKRAESLYPWLLELDLTSFGETILSPLFRRALEGAPSHAQTLLISNGLLIDDEVADLLVGSGLSELHISIDSATRETYKIMRGVDSFDKLLENCNRLIQCKERLGSSTPYLVFNYTITRKSIDDLIPLIRLAATIGFQRVHANFLIVWDSSLRSDAVYWMRERTGEILDEGDRVAREMGIEFWHPPKPLKEHEGMQNDVRFCAEAWEFMQLRAKGDISVCCMSADEIKTTEAMTWEEVWDSPAYQDFRRRVNLPDDEAPPLCRNCYYGRDIQTGDPRYHFQDESLAEHVTDVPKDANLITS